MTEFKLNLKTITEQIKFTRSKINIIKNNFKDFKKEISLNEIKELGKANNSLKESVEGSFEYLMYFETTYNQNVLLF